ncbi:hypothetical protein DFJ67_4980 [Asanoa ferruginea]|uniref:Uncharacterized protein n=1 Tax=Asanoa ferruginea TaxID=53367 RepID=A0A3D9ZNX8_9ACTN|nr:hypothetical protein [Asanoa ferruginea]REF98955.1 hypothetical protein DFJ67_4980 [Asanoa ferruginea]GIF46363.1 hypothetical protein Afe04nite_09020 [Asanoa ferruginea]
MITTQSLSLRKRRGAWVLDGSHSALRTGVSMRRGEISTDWGRWQVDITDFHRTGVVARAGERPVVRLHPNGTQVPGPGEPAQWRLSRHSGELIRGQSRIVVHPAGYFTSRLQVEVTGPWANLDLVALTACFAILTRRRKRTFTIMAIAGATGG